MPFRSAVLDPESSWICFLPWSYIVLYLNLDPNMTQGPSNRRIFFITPMLKDEHGLPTLFLGSSHLLQAKKHVSNKPRHIPILSFPACISLYAPMLRLGHLLLYLDQLVSQATKPGRRNTKPPVKQKKEQNKYIWHGKIHETSLLFSLLSCRFLYKQRHPLIWQNYIISPT